MTFYTLDERKAFYFEFGSKLNAGLHSASAVLYSFLVLAGVAWASFAIPNWNAGETTPETLGIYVIGILITVFADALMILIQGGDHNRIERAIAVVVAMCAFTVLVIASFFSIRPTQMENSVRVMGEWRPFSDAVLFLLLAIAVAMSLVLTGFDAKLPPNGALDKPVAEVKDRA